MLSCKNSLTNNRPFSSVFLQQFRTETWRMVTFTKKAKYFFKLVIFHFCFYSPFNFFNSFTKPHIFLCPWAASLFDCLSPLVPWRRISTGIIFKEFILCFIFKERWSFTPRNVLFRNRSVCIICFNNESFCFYCKY